MAIAINNRPTEILGGVFVNDLYLRFKYTLDLTGKNVEATAEVYASKDAYEENSYANTLDITEIPKNYTFVYDSEIDNSDILMFIHEKYQDYLTTDQIGEVPIIVTDPSEYGLEYDPSTGKWEDENGNYWCPEMNYLCDPKNGEPITKEEIMVPKFCMPQQLTIVDMGIAEPK